MASTTMKKDQVTPNFERAKDEATTATDKVKEAAGHAGQAISDAASAIGQKASDAASAVGQKADDATSALGSQIRSFGDTIRDSGPNSGYMGQATESVAHAVEQGGRYLEEKGLSKMADDVTSLVKQHPIPAVLISMGIGFLLARTLRS